jgi:glycosyltransferase involved in cell wall biosynthesis
MNEMAQSRVAVLMSVHAGADAVHFEAAIQSILAQTYSNFVIYLFCDGPLPAAHEEILCKRLPAGSGHVIKRSLVSQGLPAALNALIDLALSDGRAAFMARMDSDDISTPDRFQEQVAYLSRHQDVAVVGAWCIEFIDDGVPLFHKQLPANPADVGPFMLFRSPLAHPVVMFRRQVFEAGFRYDSRLLQAQDYELWSRLHCAGYRIANVPQYLLWYRLARDFYARRAGLPRAIAEFRMRMAFARKSGQFKVWHVLGFMALFSLRIAPASLKRFSYNHFRRG